MGCRRGVRSRVASHERRPGVNRDRRRMHACITPRHDLPSIPSSVCNEPLGGYGVEVSMRGPIAERIGLTMRSACFVNWRYSRWRKGHGLPASRGCHLFQDACNVRLICNRYSFICKRYARQVRRITSYPPSYAASAGLLASVNNHRIVC